MALRRKNKKNLQKLWRPDFRDVQSLPDTKVIRTGFLLNFVALAVTLLVASLYIVREYSLQSLRSSVAQLEVQVADSTAHNRVLLDANKRYRESAAIMEEVIAFDRQVIDFPAVLWDISSIKPKEILLSMIEMHRAENLRNAKEQAPFLIELTGRISSGQEETPSQILTRFQGTIEELDSLEGKQLGMDLARFNRNNESGDFDFTLQVSISAK